MKLISLGLLVALTSCGGDSTAPDTRPPDPPTLGEPRSFLMGWSPIAPRPETPLLLELIDSIAAVSEVMLVQQGVPWEPLLAGAPMDSLVQDVAQLTAS